jgi:hypothetical protein
MLKIHSVLFLCLLLAGCTTAPVDYGSLEEPPNSVNPIPEETDNLDDYSKEIESNIPPTVFDSNQPYNCKKDKDCFRQRINTCMPAMYVSDNERESGWENAVDKLKVEFRINGDCSMEYEILDIEPSEKVLSSGNKKLIELVKDMNGKKAYCKFQEFEELKEWLIYFSDEIFHDRAEDCTGDFLVLFEKLKEY